MKKKNLLNDSLFEEKNSKSESNSEIYKFRTTLFESSALKKCYVEFVKFVLNKNSLELKLLNH